MTMLDTAKRFYTVLFGDQKHYYTELHSSTYHDFLRAGWVVIGVEHTRGKVYVEMVQPKTVD